MGNLQLLGGSEWIIKNIYETYKQIAQEIIDGKDRTIYVWNTDLNFVWGKGGVIYKQEGGKCMKKRIHKRR